MGKIGWWVLFFGLNSINVESLAQEAGKPWNLQEFLNLKDALPKAVCDEAAIQRPPDLGMGAKGSRFTIQTYLEPSEAIQVLFGMLSEQLDSPEMRRLKREAENANGTRVRAPTAGPGMGEIQRQTTLEICSASVNPAKLEELLDRKSGLFIALAPRGEEPSQQIEVEDVSGRFGRIRGRWYAGGWIEFSELREVHLRGVRLARMVHPLSGKLHSIQVLSVEGRPLGFLQLTSRKVERNLATLTANVEKNAKREAEAYRFLFDAEAYVAIRAAPYRLEQVRKENDRRKAVLAVASKPAREPSEAKRKTSIPSIESVLLNLGGLPAIEQIRIHQGYVNIEFYPGNDDFWREYLEYRAKLRSFGRPE